MSALAFRVDAGPRQGAGHFMRCLALAQGWRDRRGKSLFITAGDPGPLRARLARENCRLARIAARAATPADARQTAALCRRAGAAWVVVDGYLFGADYQRRLKAAGLSVLFIDDFGHAKTYAADLVLNQNVYASSRFYARRAPETRLLLGPAYALLRREFRRPPAARAVPRRAARALVTLGGADPLGATPAVARVMEDLPLKTDVVAGAYRKSSAASAGNLHWLSDVKNMAPLLAKADLAVSAAGTTALELARCGVPALLFIAADNQERAARAFARLGAAVNMGSLRAFRPARLRAAVAALANNPARRRAMAARGRRLVDGGGVNRVLDALGPVFLRDAAPADARRLWRWASDPSVRKVSFSTAAIPWKTHAAWLRRKLADRTCALYIGATAQGRPLGQVRFDRRGGAATVSVSLDRTQRGLGLGPRLLDAACRRYFSRGGAPAIRALIKPGNAASRRAFRRAGFSPAGRAAAQGGPALVYVRRRGAAR